MAILRIKKKQNEFVILDKTGLNDNRLSWKAKDLLAYLLSLPDNWEVIISDLVKRSKDGKDSVTAALKELKKYHYVCHGRQRNQDGKFIKGEYDVYETPQTPVNKGTHPQPDFPVVDNPDVENPPLINNNISKYTNKKITTAKDNNAAAVSDHKNNLQKEDLLIGDKLTAAQKELIHKVLTPLCQTNDLDPTQIILEAEYALLSKISFTKAGDDFIRKLNTITKLIRNGMWLTPAGMLEAEQKTTQRCEIELAKETTELKSKYDTYQTFLEFAQQKNDLSAINYYQQQINQIEQQIAGEGVC